MLSRAKTRPSLSKGRLPLTVAQKACQSQRKEKPSHRLRRTKLTFRRQIIHIVILILRVTGVSLTCFAGNSFENGKNRPFRIKISKQKTTAAKPAKLKRLRAKFTTAQTAQPASGQICVELCSGKAEREKTSAKEEMSAKTRASATTRLNVFIPFRLPFF